ncbi:MAG: glyceraldehyde-3-phosphate dehydrogenase, partial [Bacteroidia bacterium]
MSLQTLDKVNAGYQEQLNDWIQQERAAIDLIGAIGKLWFEKSIELVLFRNQLVDRSATEIMKLHMYAKDIVKKPISVNDTVMLSNELLKADVCPSKIDIGKLAYEWIQEGSGFKSAGD